MTDKFYLTAERLMELKRELEDLKLQGRRRVAERLKRAKEFGDLSENSEYTEAKEEQETVERRIMELEEILKNAVVIKQGGGTDHITIGSTVTARTDSRVCHYQIVGSNEAKPEEGKISNESPLGRAFLNHRVGESIVVQTPSGEQVYYLTKIE